MYTLGINAAYHDSSAALVRDGVLIAASEEERHTRIKHAKRPVPFSAWELPFHAIDACLAHAGATLGDVAHVAYSFEPRLYVGEPGEGQRWEQLFIDLVRSAPEQLRDGVPHHLRRRLQLSGEVPYRFRFLPHHLCHQASAFLAAPFESCAVLTLDGRGEAATTTYGRFRGDRYASLGQVQVPHSLGLLYEDATRHLGFLHSSDEYKVMALAALGKPAFVDVYADAMRWEENGQFTIRPIDLSALAGPPRRAGAPLEAVHFDLAASLQLALERAVLRIAEWLYRASGERRLSMAGGVALNCLANAVLRDRGPFDAVWIQPAAGDAGTALGAALWTDAVERSGAPRVRLHNDEGDPPGQTVTAKKGSPGRRDDVSQRSPDIALDSDKLAAGGAAGRRLAPRTWRMDHAYWGPEYAEPDIEALFRRAHLQPERPADFSSALVDLLAGGAIVGWFQGRMEFGPRALGARSILASPCNPGMKARLNELKDREDFRPVAPAIVEEALGEWFEPAAANGGKSPFMLFVYRTRPEKAALIPSACHADDTARVQTVSASTNAAFHTLLKAFEKRSGVPILINTSFNVRGGPIVCTPRDAIESFFSSALDALAIGPFLLRKPCKAVCTPA